MRLNTKAILLNLLYVAQAFVGFAVQIKLAGSFGTSRDMDYYVIATNFAMTLYSFCSSAIWIATIPFHAELSARHGESKAAEALSMVGVVLSLSVVLIAAIVIMDAPGVTRMLAPGLADNSVLQTLVAVCTPYFAFMTMLSFLSGLYCLLGRYFIFSLAAIIQNLAFVALLYLCSKNIILVGWAFTLTAFLVCVLALICLLALDRQRRCIRLPGLQDLAHVRRYLTIFAPVFLANAFVSCIWIVEKNIASDIQDPGVIAAMGYAVRIVNFIGSSISYGVGLVLVPLLADLNHACGREASFRIKKKTLFYVSAAALAAGILYLVLAEPMTRVLYARGSFDQNSVHLTAMIMRLYFGVYLVTVFTNVVILGNIAEKAVLPVCFSAVSVFLGYLTWTWIWRGNFSAVTLPLSTSLAFLLYVIINTFIFLRKAPTAFPLAAQNGNANL